MWVALTGFLAAGPATYFQLNGTMYHWMALLAGAAAGEALYSYLLANAWDEQVRSERDRQVQLAKERAELEALMMRIESSKTTQAGTGQWQSDEGLSVVNQ